MFCPQCGSSIQDGASFCPKCGASLAGAPAAQAAPQQPQVQQPQAYAAPQQPQPQAAPQQPGGYAQPSGQYGTPTVVNVMPPVKQTNGVGTAGFVIALVDIFIGWVPVLGWVLWLVGLVLSLIGLGKQPRGLAIAGTILSLLGLILIIGVAACVGVASVAYM